MRPGLARRESAAQLRGYRRKKIASCAHLVRPVCQEENAFFARIPSTAMETRVSPAAS